MTIEQTSGDEPSHSSLGRHRSLGENLYQTIAEQIASGGLPPGSLLPKEAEMAVQYGVSRTVLREALVRLRYEGQIESKRGTGNRVVGPAIARTEPIFAPAPPHSIADLRACFEFRLGVEPNIAALAAQRADRYDLNRIEAAAAALEHVIRSGELGAPQDIAFHTAITQAARNTYYVRTISAIAVPVEIGMKVAATLAPADPKARLQTTLDEHRAILQAIRDRDPEAARVAMRHHIESSMARVFTGAAPEATGTPN
ncbi:FadR/GntR family transcriptional regulator [Paracoccus thiocyanatus]|uniref:GntR family transcriptional regulator n=1 Tax=Paracoccus thiocyanatus TaxID=34006 RepID=A0A3D8PF97_9RHOB|nr:FadR/GntR family transcriptional regulator [Paracoccus thiocyanatus]RDW14733.1 GntR family transcriptional regulator [Paracoccus thiocyanatus]